MTKREATRWVLEHKPTAADLRPLIAEASKEGWSRVNGSLTRAKGLRILRDGLEAAVANRGEETQFDKTSGLFLIARNIVWECQSKPRKRAVQ